MAEELLKRWFTQKDVSIPLGCVIAVNQTQLKHLQMFPVYPISTIIMIRSVSIIPF